MKEKIINYIIYSEPINKAIENIYYKIKEYQYIDTIDDFRNNFYLHMMEMKEDKLIKAYHEGYIDWLCIRVLMNQNMNRSPFYKLYRNRVIGFMDEGESDSEEKLDKIDRILLEIYPEYNYISSNDWYHYKLFKMYYGEGLTYKKIEELTKIYYLSVRDSIRNTIKLIKSRYYDDN